MKFADQQRCNIYSFASIYGVQGVEQAVPGTIEKSRNMEFAPVVTVHTALHWRKLW